jgi:hypothetical protein
VTSSAPANSSDTVSAELAVTSGRTVERLLIAAMKVSLSTTIPTPIKLNFFSQYSTSAMTNDGMEENYHDDDRQCQQSEGR